MFLYQKELVSQPCKPINEQITGLTGVYDTYRAYRQKSFDDLETSCYLPVLLVSRARVTWG